ncbi:hypothetical protein SRB17_18330 [Streptomyces sp. RB17]|nr:hypothetical protein [Streptomyces sp. RB17]
MGFWAGICWQRPKGPLAGGSTVPLGGKRDGAFFEPDRSRRHQPGNRTGGPAEEIGQPVFRRRAQPQRLMPLAMIIFITSDVPP